MEGRSHSSSSAVFACRHPKDEIHIYRALESRFTVLVAALSPPFSWVSTAVPRSKLHNLPAVGSLGLSHQCRTPHNAADFFMVFPLVGIFGINFTGATRSGAHRREHTTQACRCTSAPYICRFVCFWWWLSVYTLRLQSSQAGFLPHGTADGPWASTEMLCWCVA